MAEHLHAFFVVTGWAFLAGMSGAFFALGVVAICRWLKWSPITVTVTINNPPGQFGIVAPSPTQEGK